jgi:hypothetical protein
MHEVLIDRGHLGRDQSVQGIDHFAAFGHRLLLRCAFRAVSLTGSAKPVSMTSIVWRHLPHAFAAPHRSVTSSTVFAPARIAASIVVLLTALHKQTYTGA